MTLLLLISFASVNAVLFTPALPNIVHFFNISEDMAQQTMTLFLIGYALGQLVYAPIANRFGRKPALYAGICLQIVSSLLCVLSGLLHAYWLLNLARFLLAIGSGVGLKMTFTLVNECYEPLAASQKISHLILAFAITPGLGVALGGILNDHFGWTSCFYACAIYGLVLLWLVTRLPETQKTLNLNPFTFKSLLHEYSKQFKNTELVLGGLLMGSSTCFVYVFAAIAPFIAITLFGINSAEYGIENIIPSIGLVFGSLAGATLSKKYSLITLIWIGILIVSFGALMMFSAMLMHFSIVLSLFTPTMVIYFGLSFILANASTIALSHVHDKAHGSAVMNFINMGFATLVVLSISIFSLKALLLPTLYLFLCAIMIVIFKSVSRREKNNNDHPLEI